LRQEAAVVSRNIEVAHQKADAESAALIDRCMPTAESYADKFGLLRASIAQVDVSGLYCECGFYRGETINFIASLVPAEIHGFDSFEGLPEDWRAGHPKSTFAHFEPQVRPNVRLHRGWFEDSILDFKQKHAAPVAFLHLDADLYTSTRRVLELLADRIVAGTVLQFDEFFNYPGWQDREYKAFVEFCSKRGAEPRYLGYTRCDEQVAVKIANIETPKCPQSTASHMAHAIHRALFGTGLTGLAGMVRRKLKLPT